MQAELLNLTSALILPVFSGVIVCAVEKNWSIIVAAVIDNCVRTAGGLAICVLLIRLGSAAFADYAQGALAIRRDRHQPVPTPPADSIFTPWNARTGMEKSQPAQV